MSRARGNKYENEFMEMAEALNYCAFAARGSRGIIDVVCFDSHHRKIDQVFLDRLLVPLAIQVGTTAKAISKTLDELEAAPRPIGSLCLVARRHRHPKSRRISWTFHARCGKFDSLVALLEGR